MTIEAKRRGVHTVSHALTSRASWLVLGVVAVGVLSYGSVHNPPPSRTDRIDYLESVLKCPPCADISIGQSDDPQALALRNTVARWVGEGWSNTRIENTVVSEFGPNELLSPSRHGVELFVWLIPLLVICASIIIVGAVLYRRRSVVEFALDPESEALVQDALALRQSDR